MPPDPVDPLAPLRRDPSAAGVFADFDGTLSPIVPEPEDAAPAPGVPALLDALAARYRTVAVISGRPVAFLAAHLPPSVLKVGLYGLERLQGDQLVVDPEAERWRPVVADAVARCQRAAPAGVRVESKQLSLTLHFRGRPEVQPLAAQLAETVAAATGLEVRPARRSFELHPPVDADKGTALRSLAAGLRAVCFLGDDVGDLPAFRALDELAADGVATVRVAVRSDEVDPQVLAASDVAVDGPAGVVAVLRRLLDPDAAAPAP